MGMHRKTAVVTGSTSGIGKAAAQRLAADGFEVWVTGRDAARGEETAEHIRSAGGKAYFYRADLTDESEIRALAAAAAAATGRIDVLVNNAAAICHKPVDEITAADIDRVYALNVKAPLLLIQASLPWLRQAEGTIINISSVNGFRNDKHNLVYDMMKAALNHMTRGLALDLFDDGIRVNVVMPGGVDTPLLKQWFHQVYSDDRTASQQYESSRNNPLLGTPQQIADVISFLASSQAAWVNGAQIPVDGGVHLLPD